LTSPPRIDKRFGGWIFCNLLARLRHALCQFGIAVPIPNRVGGFIFGFVARCAR